MHGPGWCVGSALTLACDAASGERCSRPPQLSAPRAPARPAAACPDHTPVPHLPRHLLRAGWPAPTARAPPQRGVARPPSRGTRARCCVVVTGAAPAPLVLPPFCAFAIPLSSSPLPSTTGRPEALARGNPCGFSLPHPERHVQAARCCVAGRSSGLPRRAGGACSGMRKRWSPASTRGVRPGGAARKCRLFYLSVRKAGRM